MSVSEQIVEFFQFFSDTFCQSDLKRRKKNQFLNEMTTYRIFAQTNQALMKMPKVCLERQKKNKQYKMRLTFEWITNLSLAALTNECLNADVDVDKIVASFGVDVVGCCCCCFIRSFSFSRRNFDGL